MTDTDTITEPETGTDTGQQDPPADPPAASDDAPKVEMTQAELDALLSKHLGKYRKQWEAEANTAAERAAMDEAERLKAEKADAEKAADDARREAMSIRVEATAERVALKAGVSPDKVERFLRLVDLTDLDSLASDGKVDADAVTKLVGSTLDDWPEMRGTTTGTGRSGGEHNGGAGGKVWTRGEIAKMSPDEYAKHEDEILAQLSRGGIK